MATYYDKGKNCEFFEKLSDKEFAWEVTKMAQDLADMDTRGLEDILPFVGVLSIAADRIGRLASAENPTNAMVEAAMNVPAIPNRGPTVFDTERMQKALRAAMNVKDTSK